MPSVRRPRISPAGRPPPPPRRRPPTTTTGPPLAAGRRRRRRAHRLIRPTFSPAGGRVMPGALVPTPPTLAGSPSAPPVAVRPRSGSSGLRAPPPSLGAPDARPLPTGPPMRPVGTDLRSLRPPVRPSALGPWSEPAEPDAPSDGDAGVEY